MISLYPVLLSFLISGQVQSRTCLGHESLCDKKFNEVTFLTTHNSFNYARRGELKKTGPLSYLFPNQQKPIQDQLMHGVRALMLDLHYYQGPIKKHKNKVILCHGGKACDLLGKDFASDIFRDLKNFLGSHPNEILTLILESYISTDDLEKELNSSGLTPYLHCQNPQDPWPTIKEMLDSPLVENKTRNCSSKGRLVILNDKIEENNPHWNLDLFGKFAVETHYSYKKIKDLNCELNRGQRNHSLFIFNHFTTLISGKKLDAKKINAAEFLSNRVKECEEKLSKKINFLTIDFYGSGNALEVVDQMNQK
jgi:hypothetical protein